MNKNQRIIALILVGIAVVSFFVISLTPGDVAKQAVMNQPTTETVPEKPQTATTNPESGSYETYDPTKISRAKDGKVILFFHASWCPSCRALNADIEKNLDVIPEKVSILKTNYDTETELKKKYGVTYQHTLVQVDQNGAMIKKWSGSPTLNSLLSQMSTE